jgi:hypothetical protein
VNLTHSNEVSKTNFNHEKFSTQNFVGLPIR